MPLISIANAGQATLQLGFLGAIGPDEYLFRLTAANQTQRRRRASPAFLPDPARISRYCSGSPRARRTAISVKFWDCRARTVNKHLEQIYVKLGVENRASAAVKAAHVLHEI